MVLEEVGKSRKFNYREIDVMSKGQEGWKAAYEYDVPVAHVHHFANAHDILKNSTIVGKLFHRFDTTEVEKLLDIAKDST